jgi:citrate synthase
VSPSQHQTTAGTSIAMSTAEAIYIRDRNLVEELMGRLDFTSMLAFQIRGEIPSAGERAMLDAVLVTLMEHGLTPSSISARLIYGSSPDSLQSAVAGGLLAAGSAFLGSMENLAVLLQEGAARIEADEDDVDGYAQATVARLLAAGESVPGFGHHIHRPDDPRPARLIEIAREHRIAGVHVDLLLAFSRELDAAKGRHVTINATGGVAACLSDMGYPARILRGFSLIARAAGLVGHLLEEQQEPLSRELWELVEDAVPYRGSAVSDRLPAE